MVFKRFSIGDLKPLKKSLGGKMVKNSDSGDLGISDKKYDDYLLEHDRYQCRKAKVLKWDARDKVYEVNYIDGLDYFLENIKTISYGDYLEYLLGKRTHIIPDIKEKPPQTYITDPFEPECSVMPSLNPIKDGVPIKIFRKTDDYEARKERAEAMYKLPYGAYKAEGGYVVGLSQLNKIISDKYVDFRVETSKTLKYLFSEFRKDYDKPGKHSEGILMFGPPGNGKTSEISQLLRQAEEEKFYAIFIGSDFGNLNSLQDFKSCFEGETVVFVIEEITERTSENKLEDLLSFLDGELSWNHSFIIGTTNYENELPLNIVKRPGRFHHLIPVKAPSLEEKIKYLTLRGMDRDLALKVAEETENYDREGGMSLDFIAKIADYHLYKGRDPLDYIKYFKEDREKALKNFQKPVGLGR